MILDVIDGSNAIFIETNYDENMLKKGSYPLHLKKESFRSTATFKQ